MSVDEAARALAHAVGESYADMDTQTVAHIMLNVVAPIRMRLVTDGRSAVEHGRTWEDQEGGILVTLSPN
jgi:hypothetical protein